MSIITRRSALIGSAALITAASAPLAAPAAQAGDPVNATVQRAHAEWARARRSLLRALDVLAVAERRAWDAADERGIEGGTEAFKALTRKLGVDAAHDKEHRTGLEEWAAYERLIDTPADSMQDMALKCRAALAQEDSATDQTLVKALFRDLGRLAGEAPS